MEHTDEKIIHEFIETIKNEKKLVLDSLRNIVSTDALPRCVWDFNETFVLVNDAFAECFGYTRAEMEGHKFTEFIIEDDIEKSIEEYTRNQEYEYITIIDGFENRYKHKDGSIIHVKWLKGFNDFKNKIGSGQIKTTASAL